MPLRCRVLQFSQSFLADASGIFPELAACADILELSRRGALFSSATAARVGPVLAELVQAKGIRRIELFMSVLNALGTAQNTRPLASAVYQPDPSGFMSTGVNKALAYINTHLTEPFSESDLAELSGLSQSAFSRCFRRHTGMALVKFVNRLRINFACQLLMSKPDMTITDICFAAGFHNISNFNRRFLDQKGMPPSRFKALLAQNEGSAQAA